MGTMIQGVMRGGAPVKIQPDFIYQPGRNTYRHPAGETLTKHYTSIEKQEARYS